MLNKISIILFLAVSAFAMHTAELNINDKDLEVSARFDMGQFNDAVKPNTTFVGGKFFNPHKDHSNQNTEINPYSEVNFLMMREVGNKGVSVGMGVKLNYTRNNSKDFIAIPIGLEGVYKIPAPALIPMYLYGSLYYAPQVLSLADAKNFLEYRIGYDVELIENGHLTFGYRHMDTNYDVPSGSLNYNNSWYFGFKIGF